MENPIEKLNGLNLVENFWEVVAESSWDRDNNIEECRKRLMTALTKHRVNFEEFESNFRELNHFVNSETYKRVEDNVPVFEDHVMYGGDDCHFMDLPAHLIAKGKSAVIDYLSGGKVDFDPAECYAYVMQR